MGSEDYNFYALNGSTGALLWTYTKGNWFSSPAVANGTVYVGSLDYNVYDFGLTHAEEERLSGEPGSTFQTARPQNAFPRPQPKDVPAGGSTGRHETLGF